MKYLKYNQLYTWELVNFNISTFLVNIIKVSIVNTQYFTVLFVTVQITVYTPGSV